MRTFVAIDLAEELRAALASGMADIRASDVEWRGEKWVPPENLHVTVQFLGDMSTEALETLPGDIEAAIRDLKPFELPIAQPVQAKPGTRRATMLWTALSDPAGHGAELADRIETAAVAYGVVPSAKGFSAHITLCRSRRQRTFRTTEHASALMDSALAARGIAPVVSVRAVTVFTSTLTRQRPVYTRVAEVPLG